MSKKLIKMNTRKEKIFSEVWKEFITSQTAKGVSETSIKNYHQVLHNISKYFDIEIPMEKLTKAYSHTSAAITFLHIKAPYQFFKL